MNIGVDIVQISRIERLIERQPNFVPRFFTAAEVEFFKRRNSSAQVIAGNFALKEALSKALGTGFVGFMLSDVEVLRNELGAPTVRLYGPAETLFHEKGYQTILASLSHDGDYAVGMVVIT